MNDVSAPHRMTSNHLTTKRGADKRSAVKLSTEHAVSVVFLVSGAAGLIFEVVWFHRSGLVFGNSIWAMSIVLSSFMGGLALGNAAGHEVCAPRSPVSADLRASRNGRCRQRRRVTAGLPVLPTVLTPVNRALRRHSGDRESGSPRDSVRRPGRSVHGDGRNLTRCSQAHSAGWRPGLGRVLGRLYGWNTLGSRCRRPGSRAPR